MVLNHSQKKFCFCAALFCLIGFSSLLAYSIPNHVKISTRAGADYNTCARELGLKPLSKDDIRILVDSNTDQDEEVFRKLYSGHYYNPYGELGRGNIGLGSISLKPRFLKIQEVLIRKHSLKDLGELVHYVQDVTVPAHVTPIRHPLGDSFDGLDFKLPPRNLSHSDCEELRSELKGYDSYFEILDQVAKTTRTHMAEKFEYSRNNQKFSSNWDRAFWVPPASSNGRISGFGHYGIFGDHFGKLKIQDVSVEAETYGRFAARQLELAVKATFLFVLKFKTAT
jgi:hypothetical protein